jgi:RNA polymerase-binding transcription factor DksA
LDKELRGRLLRRRRELSRRLGRISTDLRHESDPLSLDSEDRAVQQDNDQVLESIGLSAEAELARLDAALRRLDDGRYAICAKCGATIERGRLEAVPYTDRCSRCADDDRA